MMSRLRFSPSAGLFPGAPLLESLQEMPAAMKAIIRAGFSAIERLSPSSRELLLKTVVQRLQDQSVDAPDEELADTLGFDKETTSGALAAASLLIVIIVSSKVSATDFVDAAKRPNF
jgi:hypothetical protein